jgi:NTE family protein
MKRKIAFLFFWTGFAVLSDGLGSVRAEFDNPQQWPAEPRNNGEIQDRQNELMGNLSLNKELDFILTVNAWNEHYKDEKFAEDHKHVTVRTIKMEKTTADEMRYCSKFNRSHEFMNQLRGEGKRVAKAWLKKWPDVPCYPDDAGY